MLTSSEMANVVAKKLAQGGSASAQETPPAYPDDGSIQLIRSAKRDSVWIQAEVPEYPNCEPITEGGNWQGTGFWPQNDAHRVFCKHLSISALDGDAKGLYEKWELDFASVDELLGLL